ncbi:MAG: hypothetical protein AB7N76_29990 [Planctomycetota bacterium]
MRALAWVALLVCTLPLLPARPARAEGRTTVIETRSGQTYQGRVIAEREDAIVLEVRRGNISAEITIPRAEIKERAARGGPKATTLRLRGAAKRARALEDPRERAQALLKVAADLEQEGDPAEAAPLYLEAGAADRALLDQAEVSAAQAWLSAGRLADAEEVLARALERNPKNSQAQGVARRLEQSLRDKAARCLEPGIRAYMDKNPQRALRLLLDACEALPRRVLDEASAKTKRELGLSVSEIMVDCRLQAICRTCEGSGVLECPAAANNTSTRCRLGRRLRYTKTERVLGQDFSKWERCKACDGRGHLRCKDCDGLGLHLTRPTAFEREDLTRTLQAQLSGLEERAGKLTDKVEKDEREAAVRSVAATELLGVLQEMRSYARALVDLDPRTGAAPGGDLRRKGQLAARRTAQVMTALANALYVGGEKRYEDAVTTEKDSHVPAAVRSVRARQAWEIVNQARMFTLEALELDPSTAGPTRGDMKRRLELMDRFLDRTWKTYLALRAAEEKAEQEGVIGKILEQAAGSVGLGGVK